MSSAPAPRRRSPPAPATASGLITIIGRAARAWRALGADQRLAAGAALGLLASMLLPWYVETYVATGKALSIHHRGVSAFGSFSFVEAAVLLVSAFVLGMLFARAEGRAFHLPGGDGSVILGAGAWTALLIFYRLLDTPSTSRHGPQVITDVGLAWGIFIALAVAIALALSGYRVRSAGVSEPPLLRSRPSAPGPSVTDAPTRASTATDSPTRVWAGTPVATASDAPTRASTASDAPTRASPPSDRQPRAS